MGIWKTLIRVVLLLAFIASLLAFAVDRYTVNSYGFNLAQYLQYSSPLTQMEQTLLREKAVLSFVSDKNAPPFAYVDEETGQYKGLILDYVNALSIELGMEIRYIPEEWEEAIKSLTRGSADFCDMFPSAERQKIFAFSDAIYRLRGIVLTRNGEKEIHSIMDLSGKQVGIPSGDYAIEYVNAEAKGIRILETRDISEALDMLMAGEVEAVIGDEPVIVHLLNRRGINDNVHILHPAIYEQRVCFAVQKENKALLAILNKGIFHLKQKDTVEKIQQKWFGLSVAIQQERLSKTLVLALIIGFNSLLLVFTFYAIQSRNLKREVRRRTRDLYQSRQNLQYSVDALSAYLVVLGADGNIANANRSFCQWVKLNLEDLLGRSPEELPLLSQIHQTYGLGKPLLENINQEMLQDKGRIFSISILSLEGDNGQLLIVADDITDQIASQQQMVQQSKMIAVGHLAAGVAHEIRNPMGNIRNYTYILKKRIELKDPVMEKSFLAIESAVHRAGTIIDNLLHFSRFGDDNWTEENLKNLLQNILYLEQQELEDRNIKVEIHCDQELVIPTKARSMHHIILNLTSNAMDAMPHGGKIRINCYKEQQFLYIEFQDDGSGIPEDLLESIFNPFFTTKETGQGTGLGLYIVYNEIQKMGGEIQVESKAGAGTMFRMRFTVKESIENAKV